MPTQPKNGKLKISQEAIDNAHLCHRDKACHKNGDGICPVAAAVSNDLIFVCPQGIPKCNYHVNFGYQGFCICPVRKEIYKNHKK